jgi:hypothetical protein
MDYVDIGQNGYVSYNWTGLWLMLNGNFVSVFVIDKADAILLLGIPAYLNGEIVDIIAWFDGNTGQYEIIGAWPGLENGIAAREILPIKQGDVITPLFLTYYATTHEWTFSEGETFTVGGSLILDAVILPEGYYNLFFLATDYSQNMAESEPVIFYHFP